MTVDTSTVTSVDDGSAYVELRTVRDPLDLMDDINDRIELWAVNRSSESVCVQHREQSGYIGGHYLVGAAQTVRLVGLGRSASGSAGIVVSPDGMTCNASQFTD
jgi:hypothetical protein